MKCRYFGTAYDYQFYLRLERLIHPSAGMQHSLVTAYFTCSLLPVQTTARHSSRSIYSIIYLSLSSNLKFCRIFRFYRYSYCLFYSVNIFLCSYHYTIHLSYIVISFNLHFSITSNFTIKKPFLHYSSERMALFIYIAHFYL